MNGEPIESWRPFFPLAALWAVLGLGLWLAQLQGWPLGMTPADHGALMLWGALGSGVLGFLYTAYARQNEAPLPSRPWLGAALALQLLSSALLALGPDWPAPARLTLALAPWLQALAWALPVGLRSLRRRWDPTTAAIPLCLFGGALGLGSHQLGQTRLGLDLGLWAFLLPLALAILDRVLPFFSTRALPGYAGRRLPGFVLPMVLLSSAAAAPHPLVSRLSALALLTLLLRQLWGWSPCPALRNPMIGALYLGLLWMVVGLGLQAGGAPRAAVQHALLLGGLGGLLLGMSMRVALGHSGLPILLGRAGLGILVAAHSGAMLRLLVGLGLTGGLALRLAAALVSLSFVAWLWRYLPISLRLRP